MAWHIQDEREIPVPSAAMKESSSSTRAGGMRRGICTFFAFGAGEGGSLLEANSCPAPSMNSIADFAGGFLEMVGFFIVIGYRMVTI